MIPLFMKKYARDLRVIQIEMLRDDYLLLRLAMPDDAVAEILPGQFVQVAISGSSTTFLRRPISINDVDVAAGTFDLLIHIVGDGTRALARSKEGDTLNCIYPLGNGFPVPDSSTLPQDVLLVGGGVGTAPSRPSPHIFTRWAIGTRFVAAGALCSLWSGAHYHRGRQLRRTRTGDATLRLGDNPFRQSGSLWPRAHDEGRGPTGPQQSLLLPCLARKHDGLRRRSLPLLRRKDRKGQRVRLHRRSGV